MIIKMIRYGMMNSKRGRPKTSTRVITKSSQEGTKDGYTRATFIVREDLLEKIKNFAYNNNKQIKQVIEEAFIWYLKEIDIESKGK